ncbi:uncharacterized protein LOC124441677 isoform X2 [Xenia sp. Carnegie-2017]|uniref:uncharacterized protein LOC124441677 isoform X2 n=1 Tax=Xenia sp. Carnegie-2017 TaxID=2897299 RepID=UPI001F03BF43|nr:uncharacterized protein LOC124441677 isoform X2 [Xenia sp. Carnegie-2017]
MSSSSSESERSSDTENSDIANENLLSNSGDEDTIVANSVVNPYENEPLANAVGENFVSVEEDADGLEPRTLEARFEGTVQLDKWCACSLCRTQLLTDAIEYRCCLEVGPTLHKLVFDGSIEKISCVTLHEEYTIMTHATVLKNVGSLLRDQDGRSYKCRRIHENEMHWPYLLYMVA